MRLLPINRETLGKLPPPADPGYARAASLLRIDQAGARLVFRVADVDVVSLHVRKANRGTSLTAMVLTIRQGNFPDGPFDDFDTPLTISASEDCQPVTVETEYLAIEVTTASSTTGDEQMIEVGAHGRTAVQRL